MENDFTYEELEIICDLLFFAAIDEERKMGDPVVYKRLFMKVARYEMEIEERMV